MSRRSCKQVAAAGHTVGAHTWSHANLNNKKLTEAQRKEEIEKGFSAVKWALGAFALAFLPLPGAPAPAGDGHLSRQPQRRDLLLRHRLLRLQGHKPEKVVETVMKKLDKLGKGIILMHDFQKHTAEALPELLRAEGRRLQGRGDAGQVAGLDAAGIRPGAAQGRQAADGQHPPGQQRRETVSE